LPQGWEIAAETHSLTIKRSKEVTGSAIFPNMSLEMSMEKQTEQYTVILKLEPANRKRDEKASIRNKKLSEEMQEAQKQIMQLRVDGKGDTYFPKTEEQKAAVIRYNKLKSETKDLPDYYYKSIAVFDVLKGRPFHIDSETERAECDRVTSDIMRILTPRQ
jgi:predicted nucleotide-binding protein (sugar kinase/HSP70/actin superfamily)